MHQHVTKHMIVLIGLLRFGKENNNNTIFFFYSYYVYKYLIVSKGLCYLWLFMQPLCEYSTKICFSYGLDRKGRLIRNDSHFQSYSWYNVYIIYVYEQY